MILEANLTKTLVPNSKTFFPFSMQIYNRPARNQTHYLEVPYPVITVFVLVSDDVRFQSF